MARPRLLASALGLGSWPRLLASALGLGSWPRLLASALGLGLHCIVPCIALLLRHELCGVSARALTSPAWFADTAPLLILSSPEVASGLEYCILASVAS